MTTQFINLIDQPFKMSHGLNMMLEPLANLIALPESLMRSIRKSGKRGKNGVHYPNDLARNKVILDTTHENGKSFSVEVIGGNFDMAIQALKNFLAFEDMAY